MSIGAGPMAINIQPLRGCTGPDGAKGRAAQRYLSFVRLRQILALPVVLSWERDCRGTVNCLTYQGNRNLFSRTSIARADTRLSRLQKHSSLAKPRY